MSSNQFNKGPSYGLSAEVRNRVRSWWQGGCRRGGQVRLFERTATALERRFSVRPGGGVAPRPERRRGAARFPGKVGLRGIKKLI